MRNGKIIEYGEERYFLNDKLHREDGPAVIYPNGTKYWYKHGKRHREDGPAEEYSEDDSKIWFYDGKCLGDSLFGYTQEKFEMWKRFKAFL